MAREARRAAFAASFRRSVQIAETVPAKAGRLFHEWCSDFEVRTHSTRRLLRTSKSEGATTFASAASNLKFPRRGYRESDRNFKFRRTGSFTARRAPLVSGSDIRIPLRGAHLRMSEPKDTSKYTILVRFWILTFAIGIAGPLSECQIHRTRQDRSAPGGRRRYGWDQAARKRQRPLPLRRRA
jgi:hypothetical protein